MAFIKYKNLIKLNNNLEDPKIKAIRTFKIWCHETRTYIDTCYKQVISLVYYEL